MKHEYVKQILIIIIIIIIIIAEFVSKKLL
jgi:hypothetical protein